LLRRHGRGDRSGNETRVQSSRKKNFDEVLLILHEEKQHKKGGHRIHNNNEEGENTKNLALLGSDKGAEKRGERQGGKRSEIK